MRALLLIFGAALLAACAVGPDYKKPDTPTPQAFNGTAASPAYVAPVDAAAGAGDWWTQFGDAELNHLVQLALAGNFDIQGASARIEQARAQREAAAAPLFPSFSGSAQGTRYRVPDSLRNLPEEEASQAGGPAAGSAVNAAGIHLPSYLSVYQVGFDASWELDLFGRTRRAVEAADDSTQAAIAARRGAVVSVLGELGNDYVNLRGLQARLAVAHRTVDIEQQLLELTRNRQHSGMASELDVERAQAQLDTSTAQLPLLDAQRLQAVHAIAVLVGRLPEDMETELAADAPQLPQPPQVPVDLPSEVLRRRPDVQQAERQLAAATAQVGVAEAQRFPTLSLTGSTGLASDQLDKLLRASNWTWNAGAALSAPIFQGGELEANQRAAEAAARQSEAQYRKTVLQAFSDTEDALQGYAAQCQSLQSVDAAAQANHLSLERATDLYRAGLASYLDVLDADRSYAQSQDQQVQAQASRMQQLIALYKALGGGWQAAEPPQPKIDPNFSGAAAVSR